MKSPRDAGKCVAVEATDETRVPRLLWSPNEVRESRGAERAADGVASAFEAQDWYKALGIAELGSREKSGGKSGHRTAPEGRGSAANAAVHLQLPQSYLDRVRELRQAFARAGDHTDVGERILEDFAATDAGLAEALLDSQAAAVALLQKAGPTDPEPSLKMVEVADGIGRVLAGVRSRVESSLAAAAGLRAQRLSIKRETDGK